MQFNNSLNKKLFVLVLLMLIFVEIEAQEKIVDLKNSVYCVPAVLGIPRSKGLVIKQEALLGYSIKSNEEGAVSEAEVMRNRRWEFKLRAPVINKDAFKLAVGVKYTVESFKFENPNLLDFPFYQNLEDKSLKSLQGEIFLVKPTLGNKYYILRATAGFNGDYNSERFGADKSEFLKFSIMSLLGWKKNDYLSYAVGLSFGYNFGKRSIFPIFSYNKTFNKKWGLESALPVNAKLRYNTLNQKNYFYLTTELKGANYGLHLNDDQTNPVFLDKSELRLLLIWEREIHDWLWFGIEGGYRKNISFDLANSADINSNVIIDNSLNDAFVFNLSIFIVPPRRFLQ